MKLAIIGSSPIALEAALRFHAHGAALTWFNAPEEEPEAIYPSFHCQGDEYCSQLGLELLGRSRLTEGVASWQEWQQQYAEPLTQKLRQSHSIRSLEVVSVTKRYLAPGETIHDRSRFYDLFRVIFLVNPSEFIEQQKNANPETYQRLSSEMVQSLHHTLEMYEDFDVVLDLRRENLTSSMAATGRALGEGRVPQGKIFYNLSAVKQSLLIKPAVSETRELALIGSGAEAAEIVIALSAWLNDERNRLFVVSTEADPFASFLGHCKKQLAQQLQMVFDQMEENFNREKDIFHQKLREWQALDDFIQVKYPRPTEPIPRLVFFSGHNATAVDQLIDRPRLFLTLEKPDFREGIKQPENNHLELKTIGVDVILAAMPRQRKSLAQYLDENEIGYYAFIPAGPSINDGWRQDLTSLKGIENEIFKLFSPANT